MEDPECERCPLFLHRRASQLPSGTELAWTFHARVAGAGVQRYGLQDLALQTVNLDMDQLEAAQLLEQVDAIAEGLDEARRAFEERKAKK